MSSGYFAAYSEGRRSLAGGRGSIFLGMCFLVLCTILSFFFHDRLGMMGLIIMGAGILGGICGLILMLRFPIWLGMLWFLSMSGLQTLGMLRTPGLPDFSFSRLFMVAVLVLLPIGVLKGKVAFRIPSLPDLLLIAYTFYVFLNMNTLGEPLRFNTWLASCFAPALAYFFARQYVYEENHLRAIFLFLILVTVYFWVTSFGEHFEIPQLVWPRIIMDREYGNSWYGRSRGPFIQPAVFGQLIGMYLIVHLYFLTRKIRRIWKLLIIGNIGFGLIGLLYTYTRGGWLATAFGFIILAILRPNFRKIMFVVAGVGLLVGALGLLQPKDDEFLAERMETTNTIDNRLGFLANAMRMIRDKPLFGVGYFRFNEYRHLYNQGTTIPLYGFVKRKAGTNVTIHDIYIGRAAEEGLVGLFLFLSFYGVVGLQFVKRWKRHPEGRWFDKDMLAMLAAFFGAYFVGGMVIDYRYFDLINVLPAFFAGIIVGFPEPRPKIARPIGEVSVSRSGS